MRFLRTLPLPSVLFPYSKFPMNNINTLIPKSDHATITAQIPRNSSTLTTAKIIEISSLTPTVKSIILQILQNNDDDDDDDNNTNNNSDNSFNFLPGQWVDFHIKNIPTIGGFSICSTPQQYKLNSTLQLAIKYSTHPPAYYIHNSLSVNETVKLRVGGTFYYNSEVKTDNSSDCFIIAGGVGLTPCISIIRERMSNSTSNTGKTYLFYSVKTGCELLFQQEIEQYHRDYPDKFNYIFTITGSSNNKKNSVSVTESKSDYHTLFPLNQISEGIRIRPETIAPYLNKENPEKNLFFLCGPNQMLSEWIEKLNEYAENNKLLKENIRYEKWW